MTSPVGRAEIFGLLVLSAASQMVFAAYAPWAFYFDLPLAATLYIGWYSGPIRGAACGTLLGLTQDVTQLATLLGLNGFSKTLIGFLASYLSRWLVSDSFPTRAAAAFAMSLLDGLLALGLEGLFEGSWSGSAAGGLLIRAAVTGVATALFFSLYDRVKFPEKDFRRKAGG